MANSTSRSRLAAVCLYLGFGKGGRRWISLHDRLARHESAMTANTLCSDTSHIPDWPCRFLYPAAFSRPYFCPLPLHTPFTKVFILLHQSAQLSPVSREVFSDKMRKCIAEDLDRANLLT